MMLRIEFESTVSLSPNDMGLLDLVRECDRYNRDRIVTGFLHYDGKRFHQILEGPEDVVTSLFETLRWDPRHHEVQITNRSAIEARRHADFSFRYVAQVKPRRSSKQPVPTFALFTNNPEQDRISG